MTAELRAPRNPDADIEVRTAAALRLTYLVDAVIAIAITLLALNLPVPVGTTNAAVLRSVVENWHVYLAFMISFVVIGAHWTGHHRVFRYLQTLGGRLTTITLYWLLTQVVTPFTTNVLTGNGAFQARFILYAGVQAASGILFILMIREIEVNGLYRPDVPPGLSRNAIMRTASLTAGFLVSIPVSFAGESAYACWIVVPLLLGAVNAIRRRRNPVAPLSNRR